ncbi:MAG TPA: SRPBCC domain-containing protein [Gemmatimonadaceae bacterium]|nr:SRPBCC domain-containing protein [Gemmatimonadaceae bacterium]
MPTILHDLPIRAPAARVFDAIAHPDSWWTLRSAGVPALGARYALSFGPEYEWGAVVSACEPGALFEWEMVEAMADWVGTRVRFALHEVDGVTTLRFAHAGWGEASEHFRVSAYCWAMYLRLLRRFVESGEVVPYDRRLDA